MVWMETEQIGPDWDRRRHAELMAALHNGPLRRRGTEQLFGPADFLRDPWAPPPPPPDPAEQLFSRLDAFYSE